MNKKKLALLTTCLGVSSIAVALVLTANHMYSGAFGLGIQRNNENATSKTFTLNLGTEHTFDSNNKLRSDTFFAVYLDFAVMLVNYLLAYCET